jgi:uncharacterized protein YjiS (DUF1127 family)
MKWITRERARVDRIACPWLIARFIDEAPEFRFLPAHRVLGEAQLTGGIPFDVPGAELRGDATRTCFDAFLARYGIDDPALHLLAAIVRGAHSRRTDLAPQSAGLLAISYGLAHGAADDRALQIQGFLVYDALYRWCRKAPPGPDFAPRIAATRPATGWRPTLRRLRERRRTARILAALHTATLRAIALDRGDAERTPAPSHRRSFDHGRLS